MKELKMVREALHCIRELVRLQERLCRQLRASYEVDPLLFKLPSTGSLELEGERWDFRKHGVGVAFTQPRDGVEVDVHAHLDLPEAFDAWRLHTFCLAAGVEILAHQGLEWRTEDRILRDLLDVLARDGQVEPIANTRAYFRLVSGPERLRSTSCTC
ncbi:MAG: hypothetical protein KA190_26475 [Kofleriaceae bacterium]|nr:hypothetical protein [Kofleriaceae bacterium]